MPGGHIKNAPRLATGGGVNEHAIIQGPGFHLFASGMVGLQDFLDEPGIGVIAVADVY